MSDDIFLFQIQYDEDWVFSSSAQCVESCRGENYDYAVTNWVDLTCHCIRDVDLPFVNPYSCEDEDNHPFEVTCHYVSCVIN